MSIVIAISLREMYLKDFNETCSEKKALSVEDKKFIDLMKQELISGHFHLLLPLKKTEHMFPENRAMTWNRLKSVKNKMVFGKITLNLCQI